jgi:RNA polymerase sigma factor (sigma-70 family)
MSISEKRQEAERLNLLSRRSHREMFSSGFAASPSTAIVRPDCIGKDRKYSCRQLDATGGGELFYAVYKATESAPTYLSSRAGPSRKTDRRFVEEDVSDEMLLRNVAKGDKAAMHIMFVRHRTRVFRFILRMVRNPTIADDLVGQLFLDVWRSANRFESRSRVSAWLLSIARLKAISFLRQRTHENIDKGDVLGIADAGDTPEVALDRKETHGILHACVDNLSPAHREIINLFYCREKSIAEVSEIVGIPHATARSRLFYARKKLARILVSAGFEAAAARTNIEKGEQQDPLGDCI